MDATLEKWIGDTEALVHHANFKVSQTTLDYNYISTRIADYYTSLVGELFENFNSTVVSPSSWSRLANAFSDFSSEALKQRALQEGISSADARLFAAAAFYCGGFPASAYLTLIDWSPEPTSSDILLACCDLLARPESLRSSRAVSLVNGLRLGGLSDSATLLSEISAQTESALERGPDEWIPYRLFEKLLERFSKSNLRSVLPDGSNQFWTPLVSSLLARTPQTWEFFPSQQEAIRAGLLTSRQPFALQMPTGAGKTTLCETLLYAETKANDERVGVLLVPFRSLAAELRGTLVAQFNDMGLQARCAYGGSVPSGAEVAQMVETRVLVATPESLSGILSADPEFYRRISLVICDEGHLLDSPGRGIGLELLLARMKARPSGAPRFVFISAIVPNVEEINAWLGGQNDGVVRSEYRPAVAEFATLAPTETSNTVDLVMHPHQPEPLRYAIAGFLRKEYFRYVAVDTGRPRHYPFATVKTRAVAAARKALVMGAVAIFAANKRGDRGCVGLANELIDQLNFPLDLPRPLEMVNAVQLGLTVRFLEAEYGADWIVAKTLAAGAIVHHGDIPQEAREVLEGLLRRGDVKLAFCTSTLAEGVNLPIRTLVLYSVSRTGPDGRPTMLSAREIKNLVGRAGRPGSNTRGLVICSNLDQWPAVASVANQAPGHNVTGALRVLMSRLRDSLAISNTEVSNSWLERVPALFPVIDGIDTTLIDLAAEELGHDRLVAMASELSDQTFASSQATNESKALLRTVFRLRAERVAALHATGRLHWIRSSGAKVRLVERVETDLFGRRPQWDNVTTPLDPELFQTIMRWAWTLPDVQVAAREAFRIAPNADTAPAFEKTFSIAWGWLTGRRFREIAADASLSIDDLLGIHTTLIGFALQTIVEQGLSLLAKSIEASSGVLAPAVVNFPNNLRFGVPSDAGRLLAMAGIRHRSAYVALGHYVQENAIPLAPFSQLKESLRASMVVQESAWRERLGALVYQNTLRDLL